MTDAEILREARDRFKRCLDAEHDNRERALEAIKFRHGEQWPEAIKRMRLDDPNGARPCLTLDKTGQYIRQVVNDQRQNRPSIKVRPVDDQGDPEVAEIIQGLVRNIEQQSDADVAYDTAIEHAADGGYGYIRIITEYEDPASFDQCIRIRRVRNRFTCHLDPAAVMPTGIDAKYGFVTETLTRDEAERKYGKERVKSWYDNTLTDDKATWCNDDSVRIAEYYCIKPEKKTLVLLSDGRAMFEDELDALPEAERTALTVIDQRDSEVPVTMHYKLVATEILEQTEFPAAYIPIVRVIGNESDIEGKVSFTGMIDTSSMDAQRMYNYAASAFVERVALEPTAPYIAAAGQVESNAEDWRRANRSNVGVLTYDAIEVNGHPVPAPQRQPMGGVPQGWMVVFQQMEHSIQASLGMYSASVGEESNEKSGRAILARQKEGDTATFHYLDNLGHAISHIGRIVVDMIPRVYSTRKVLRTIGEDGAAKAVRVDFDQQAAVRKFKGNDGALQRIYNPGLGKYDIVTTTGPGYNTKRQEAAAVLTELASRNPAVLQFGGDLVFRSLDAPYMDELADRFKKLLPAPLQETEDDETMPPAAIAAIRQRDMALAQAQQVIAELQPKAADNVNAGQKIALDREKNTTDSQRVALERERNQLERDRLMRETDTRDQQFQAITEGLVNMAQSFQMLTQQLAQAQAKNDEAMQAVLQLAVEDRDGAGKAQEVTVAELRQVGSQIVEAVGMVQQAIVDGRAKALQLIKDASGNTSSVQVTPERGEVRDVAVTLQ